ncbi:MAG: LPXTG cell wall anchor domain-containing protein [Bacilli bacterium]|nr:LPXTG cell wall anchor domain-containing protein [Bacilli bacterium]
MKKLMSCVLLVLALMVSLSISSSVLSDTLTHEEPSRGAIVGIEAVVPETVTVRVIMTGGSFKIGDKIYTNQATLTLPYASSLTILAVDSRLTHAAVAFEDVPSTYQLTTEQLVVDDMRADGEIVLSFEQDAPPQPSQPPQASDLPQTSGQALPTTGQKLPITGESIGIGLGLLGLVILLIWLIVVAKRRRETKAD